MLSKQSRALLGVLLAALLGLAALGAFLTQGNVRAQEDEPETDETVQQPEQQAERVIQVNGHGIVSAQPDQAIVRFGVQTQSESAGDALEENNVLMQEVISATLEAGIAEDDIQTQQLRLEPVYSQTVDAVGPLTLTGYRAINNVVVTVQDLGGLGDLLDAAVAAGANTVEGIHFEIGDRQALAAQAREAAVTDAMQKAEQLAQLTGTELGIVMTITEIGTAPPQPFPEADVFGIGGAVPIAPGTQTVEAHVQVSWQLE